MSNNDAYLYDAAAAIGDVLVKILPELDEDERGDVAFEIAGHLDKSKMLLGGYTRGSY